VERTRCACDDDDVDIDDSGTLLDWQDDPELEENREPTWAMMIVVMMLVLSSILVSQTKDKKSRRKRRRRRKKQPKKQATCSDGGVDDDAVVVALCAAALAVRFRSVRMRRVVAEPRGVDKENLYLFLLLLFLFLTVTTAIRQPASFDCECDDECRRMLRLASSSWMGLRLLLLLQWLLFLLYEEYQ
jgi:hypothetical protein